MAHRSIEEVFQTIAPSRRRGIPNPSPIGEGFTSGTGDANSSVSQVAQEITQLRSVYQQQQDLITANTQAVQNNTSAKGSSAGSTIGHVTSSLFGGALGFLSPLVSGIMGLFGGGGTAPAALPVYTPPPPIAIDGLVRAASSSYSQTSNSSVSNSSVSNPSQSSDTQTSNSTVSNAQTNSSQSNLTTAQSSYSPQITVNVSAMDSQSFLDRSMDIANAVREAMLNNHPINGVVTDL